MEELTLEAAKHTAFEYDIPILRVWWPDSTFFDVGDDELRTDAHPIIEYVVNAIRLDISQLHAYIIGHTDSTGSSELNDDLALRRAQSVVKRLSEHDGILLSSLAYTGMGEKQPISTNSTAQGRAVNRRVEFVLSISSEANIAITEERDINEEFLLDGPGEPEVFEAPPIRKFEVYKLEKRAPYEVYELEKQEPYEVYELESVGTE